MITDSGRSGRRIASEQEAFALEAARLERKAIRLRLLEDRERVRKIRKALTKHAGVVFLDADTAYEKRRNAIAARRKGETRSWEKAFRLADQEARRAAREAERAEVERRRIARLMQSAPGASTAHRGTKSTYNTADRGAVRREPDAPRERLTDGRRHPVTVARASDSRGRMRP